MFKNYRYFWFYLAVVFIISWSLLFSCMAFSKYLTPLIGKITMTHPLIIFILYLPSIAGLLTYYCAGGISAVKNIFLKLIPRAQDLFWFPVLFFIFGLFALTMHYASILMGVQVPLITYTLPEMISKALWNFIGETGLIGGIFGWVGFVLPFLQSKLKNNVLSGLLTGCIFGLWVLPGYGITSMQAATSYLLYVVQLMTFLMFASYIFNATKGNLSFYLFAFWLAATGSHIQLYYFNMPVQIMEIIFLTLATVLIHFVVKKAKIDCALQEFPDFIQNNPSTIYNKTVTA